MGIKGITQLILYLNKSHLTFNSSLLFFAPTLWRDTCKTPESGKGVLSLSGALFSQPVSRVLFFKLSSILAHVLPHGSIAIVPRRASNPCFSLFLLGQHQVESLGVANCLTALNWPLGFWIMGVAKSLSWFLHQMEFTAPTCHQMGSCALTTRFHPC